MTTILTQRRLSRGLLPAVAAALWLAATGPASGDYTLQVLAQAGDVIDGRTIDRFSHEYTNVAINNDREVAFFAGVTGPEGTGYSVLTQRRFIAGAGKIIDGTVPAFNNEDHQVDINSSGQVVYTAFLPQGGRGLFVNEDLLLRPGDIVGGSTIASFFRFTQINDSGTVVFDGRSENGPAIFSQTRLIAESGQAIGAFTLGTVIYPRIGNNGHVAFFGSVTDALSNSSAVVAPSRVVLKVGDVLDGKNVGSIHSIGNITDNGETPITVSLGEWPVWTHYVVTENRVLFRGGEVIASQAVIGLSGTNTVLNNRGDLALLGAIERQDGTIYETLFAGGKLVASEGDLFDGKTIGEIFPNFDMNDRGDVAFRVAFHDGTRAVILATIPEPPSRVLGMAAVFTAIIVWRCGKRRTLASRRLARFGSRFSARTFRLVLSRTSAHRLRPLCRGRFPRANSSSEECCRRLLRTDGKPSRPRRQIFSSTTNLVANWLTPLLAAVILYRIGAASPAGWTSHV